MRRIPRERRRSGRLVGADPNRLLKDLRSFRGARKREPGIRSHSGVLLWIPGPAFGRPGMTWRAVHKCPFAPAEAGPSAWPSAGSPLSRGRTGLFDLSSSSTPLRRGPAPRPPWPRCRRCSSAARRATSRKFSNAARTSRGIREPRRLSSSSSPRRERTRRRPPRAAPAPHRRMRGCLRGRPAFVGDAVEPLGAFRLRGDVAGLFEIGQRRIDDAGGGEYQPRSSPPAP